MPVKCLLLEAVDAKSQGALKTTASVTSLVCHAPLTVDVASTVKIHAMRAARTRTVCRDNSSTKVKTRIWTFQRIPR